MYARYYALGTKIFMLVMLLVFGITSVFASAVEDAGKDFPFGQPKSNQQGADTTDIGKIIKEEAIDPQDSASEKIQKELGVAYDTGTAKDQRATYYIQQLINRVLAIIGLVALAVLIYGFYQMFAQKDNEAGYKEAVKIVQGAIIAIVVIGVSRYLVSILFDVFFVAKEDVT